MDPTEYVFRIDAFTPDSLPMSRLAEYLAALAKMIGHEDNTHFVSIEEGSAQLVHRVEAVDAPKVEARLNGIRTGSAPRDAEKARSHLDDLLANDNAIGSLTERRSGKVIVPFVGRNRPKPVQFPPFREDAAIQGQVVSIGGRDKTAHAILQDGDLTHTNLSMSREVARRLSPLLYGPLVRLHGNGRFERGSDGIWKMLDFRVQTFEEVDQKPIADALKDIRELEGNPLMQPDAYLSSIETSDDEDGEED